MSQRAFLIALALLAGFILLCTSEAVGAMIGFLTGITIAFFAAPLVYAAQAGLHSAGIAASATDAATILLCGAGLLLLGTAIGALWAWRRGALALARLLAFKALALVSLPLAGWLSLGALARAWP